ncbi:MAG: response regulator transcription factor, partial [Candidatus Acidiferrum sp.]
MGQIQNFPGSEEVSVFLLAENRLLRDTLARLLRKKTAINVVGISRDGKSVLNEITESRCALVLTDCFGSDSNTGLIVELLAQNPDIRILLFGMDEDPGTFLHAVQLGVRGYVLKDASAAEIVAAVRAVARGEASCPPRLCLTLIQNIASEFRLKRKNASLLRTDKNGLTHRQLQLMNLVAQGLTNKEIAAHVNLSEFTV